LVVLIFRDFPELFPGSTWKQGKTAQAQKWTNPEGVEFE
jgi:hypothetical protein